MVVAPLMYEEFPPFSHQFISSLVNEFRLPEASMSQHYVSAYFPSSPCQSRLPWRHWHMWSWQLLFFLYYHLVGIFPWCYPLKWDAVWGQQRSWHIEHHWWFGRGPEQCPSRRSGLTSIVWEAGYKLPHHPLNLAEYLGSVYGCGSSLASCWATVFKPRPSTAPHQSPSPRCCALGSQLPWCRV